MQGKGTETKMGEYERDHDSGLQRKESEREREGNINRRDGEST